MREQKLKIVVVVLLTMIFIVQAAIAWKLYQPVPSLEAIRNASNPQMKAEIYSRIPYVHVENEIDVDVNNASPIEVEITH